jgi:hypothetical protein
MPRQAPKQPAVLRSCRQGPGTEPSLGGAGAGAAPAERTTWPSPLRKPETVHGITSLTAWQANPGDLLDGNRGH